MAFGYAYPELLTKCRDDIGSPLGTVGNMNIVLNETWTFLHKFYQEVADVFPDEWIHFGGDELGEECA